MDAEGEDRGARLPAALERAARVEGDEEASRRLERRRRAVAEAMAALREWLEEEETPAAIFDLEGDGGADG